MKSRVLAILLVVALLVVATVFTTQAAKSTEELNKVSANLKTTPIDVTATDVECPCCGTANVEWVALPERTSANVTLADGTHYYVPEGGSTGAYRYSLGSKSTVCIYLNGQTITNTAGRAFFVEAGCTLYVMEASDGNGTVTGLGEGSTTTNYKGIIDASGTVVLCGGTYTQLSTSVTPIVTMRSVWGHLKTYNGTKITEAADHGSANILMNITNTGSTAKVTMYGGTITGANNTNVLINTTLCQFNMYGSSKVTGGSNANGGNFRMLKASTINLASGTVEDGEATTGAGGNFYIAAGGTLNITGGKVIGGVAATNGGNIFSNGTVNIGSSYGNSEISGGEANKGGNVYASGASAVLAITKGEEYTTTIKDGTGTTNSGNIYANAATQSITGATITGGSAPQGGSIYVNTDKTLTINAGTEISGGTATITYEEVEGEPTAVEDTGLGGAIYVAGTLDIDGGSISGTAEENGGAIYAAGTVTIDGATISGSADGFAGGVYVNGGDVTMGANSAINGTVDDQGNKTQNGGNVYLKDGTFNMNGGTISNGYFGNAGNVRVQGGEFNMTSGTVSGGKATNNGGNFFCAGGTLTVSGDAKIENGDAGVNGGNIGIQTASAVVNLNGGEIKGNDGGGLSVHAYNGTLNLGGTAVVDRIYVRANSSVVVQEAYAGDVYLYFDPALLTDPIYGTQITSNLTAAGAFTGKLRLVNKANAWIYRKDDGTLWVSATTLVKAGEEAIWVADNAAAVTKFEAGDYDYITLYLPESELALNGETVNVNFNGRDVNVTGNGTLYAMDNNEDTSGAATVAEDVDLKLNYTAPNGTIYIALQNEDETYTCHSLKMDITGVSLRTTTGGIYYWASVKCDDTLAGNIDSFGILFGIGEQAPTALGTDATMFSEITEGILTDGTEMNGAVMNYVLEAGREDPTNDTAGVMQIWGVPYITITADGDGDGYDESVEILAGEECSARMSMYDILSKLNTYVDTLEGNDKTHYLNLLTEPNFDWEGYAFTEAQWTELEAALNAKKEAL